MSRKIWGIALTAFAVVIIATFGVWYLGRSTATPPEEQNGTELVEMLPTKTQPDQVTADKETTARETAETMDEEAAREADAEAYQFILVNNNNYVAVYQLPENEIYEYTDVILDVLPADLQEEIRQGKYLKNEEELYNFLENYTS